MFHDENSPTCLTFLGICWQTDKEKASKAVPPPTVAQAELFRTFETIFISPGKDAKYCDQHVCVSLSLRSRISKTTHPNFTKCSVHAIHLWPWLGPPLTTMHAIPYILPVLRMTSRCHIMERMGQNQRRRVSFVQFARWRHRGGRGQSLLSLTASCFLEEKIAIF